MLTGLLLYRTNFYIVCFSKVFGCLLFNVLGVLLVVCKGVGSSSVSACAPNLIHIHFYFDVPVFLRLCSRSFQYRTRNNKDTELHLKKISCNHVIIKNNLMNKLQTSTWRSFSNVWQYCCSTTMFYSNFTANRITVSMYLI